MGTSGYRCCFVLGESELVSRDPLWPGTHRSVVGPGLALRSAPSRLWWIRGWQSVALRSDWVLGHCRSHYVRITKLSYSCRLVISIDDELTGFERIFYKHRLGLTICPLEPPPVAPCFKSHILWVPKECPQRKYDQRACGLFFLHCFYRIMWEWLWDPWREGQYALKHDKLDYFSAPYVVKTSRRLNDMTWGYARSHMKGTILVQGWK